MSSELRAYLPTGSTLYAVLINSAGQVWNTSGTPAFEAYNGANWTDYDIALTEAGAGLYFANMPAAVAGNYSYVVYERAGASPATTDSINGMGTLSWDGSAEVGLSTIAGRLPSSLTANGNMKSSLVEILTTALTETAGLLAGAFKKFFNVSSPTGTVNSFPDVVPGNTGGLFTVNSVMNANTINFVDESTLDSKLTTLAALAATSLPNTTAGSDGGLAIVGSSMDMGSISGDSGAADNLEAMLDGTGGVALKLKSIDIVNSDALPNGIGVNILSAYNAAMAISGGADGIAISTASGSDIRLVAPSYGGAADYGIEFSGEFSGAGIGGDTETTAIKGNITGNLSGSVGSLATQAKADVNAEVVDVLRTDTIPDSVPADGAQPTIAQAIYLTNQRLYEAAVTGTTLTVYKPDGTTALVTCTINDASTPTSITRAT